MDIISLSKASKALREIIELDEDTVGKEAEAHFKTVDHRLDWIEGQADKILVENSLKIDLSKGVFHNTKLIDGKLKLAKNNSSYFPSGYWESPIIDLGAGWQETNIVNVIKETLPQTDIGIKVSTSNDGVSFTEYSLLDEENPPQARYLKIRVTLSSEEDIKGEERVLVFNQLNEGVEILLSEFIESNGSLTLKEIYKYDMNNDNTWEEEGLLQVKAINPTQWRSIDSLSVLAERKAIQ